MFTRGFLSGTVAGVTLFGLFDFWQKREHGETGRETSISGVEIPSDSSVLEDVKKLDAARSILKYGVPDSGPYVRYFTNHVLMYDQAKKTPVWVAELITKDNIQGPANRKNVKFKPDPSVPSMFTAQNSDYLHSGWSRGHMAPAGDNKNSQQAMKETFYLSNILPQNLENNGGFWNRMEMFCRDLTQRFQSVRVISGPLILPSMEENGVKIVKYPVIGQNQVAVPTHLYKVIIGDNNDSKPVAVGAFVIPNEPIGFNHSLKDYQVNLVELEKNAGIIFLPKLEKAQSCDLCSVVSCQLMDQRSFELYFIGRRLASANTLERLNTVWSEVEQKKLIPDEYILNLYKTRSKELQSITDTKDKRESSTG